MLHIGERVGTGRGPAVDIALDPLEGTTITAKGGPNAISCIAMAPHGGFLQRARRLHGEDRGRPRPAGGRGRPRRQPAENLGRLAEAKGVPVGELVVLVLDRPRHQELIARRPRRGRPHPPHQRRRRRRRGRDLAARDRHRHLHGQRRGARGRAGGRGPAVHRRPVPGPAASSAPTRTAPGSATHGHPGPERVYELEELARGDVMFSATGVTDGTMLQGRAAAGPQASSPSRSSCDRGPARCGWSRPSTTCRQKSGVVPYFRG